MRPKRILILGGTRDAVELASLLVAKGHDVITSLAGVTREPSLPAGRVRRGGFGGAEGLRNYVREQGIDMLVDATHPFAAQISSHAAEAGVPLFRLERPAWLPESGDAWQVVNSVVEAAAILPAGARVLLTIGRKEVQPFFARADLSGVARMIEPLAAVPPPGWRVILERPPHKLESELQLMTAESITSLVTKNAGGALTVAKLLAAREKKIHVVMIARPPKPPAPTFVTAQALAAALSP